MTSHFINYFVRRLEAFKIKNKLTSTKSVSSEESIAIEEDKIYTGEAVDECEFCKIVSKKEFAHIVSTTISIIISLNFR